MTDPIDTAAADPSSLEKGLAQHDDEKQPQQQQRRKKHHHHHHPHLHLHLRRKREAEKIQSKLPGFMQTDDADLDKLRTRLTVKNEVIAAVAEFIGTFLFLLFSFGGSTSPPPFTCSSSSATTSPPTRVKTETTPLSCSAMLMAT
ncbi:hypothetical protein V8E36_001117 [Tilletia maclaganii]